MRNSVRNGRQTALAAVTGAVFVAMGTYILVTTNRVDSTVEMNAVTVVVFGIGTWCYLKFVVHRRTDFGEGSMRLRELFTDRVVATNEVASVHSDDGLYCLLRGGGESTSPASSPR